eukprot:gene6277-6920_t
MSTVLIEEVHYDPQNYIQTSTGNIISRQATISMPQSLEIPGGKCFIAQEVHIRADLAAVQLQKYSYLDRGCLLRPGYVLSQPIRFIPMTIGMHSYIGQETIVEAACIGSGCFIGQRCILSARCILKDYVKVLDDTVVPPDMVLPACSVVGGSPARILSFQSEAVTSLAATDAIERYQALKPLRP